MFGMVDLSLLIIAANLDCTFPTKFAFIIVFVGSLFIDGRISDNLN